MRILEKNCPFEFEAEKKVGHMRCDFQDGSLANSWFPTDHSKDENVNLTDIQNTVNSVMFDELTTFEKVVELCGGEGYDFRQNRFFVEGDYNYWIDLIPAKGDYNYYIHVYTK
jgi:hypothetical protein